MKPAMLSVEMLEGAVSAQPALQIIMPGTYFISISNF